MMEETSKIKSDSDIFFRKYKTDRTLFRKYHFIDEIFPPQKYKFHKTLLIRTLASLAASSRALAACAFSLAISSWALDAILRGFARCCVLATEENPSADSIEARAASATVDARHRPEKFLDLENDMVVSLGDQ